ncbi:hypothetical protein C7212DRAFT_332825 [Tuber magnatum]|uniref:Uncharacterized protein n=1 Tax=Tuber magnatum TaxID=42249 RepID=A0A317SJ02_9PEZI|nr:hypothetical protein C7212DRAFT_332824 [Tuber magnatum]PWW73231.1 hypothetical protein C7212DRAFT_332825 [Tuber magnatum]
MIQPYRHRLQVLVGRIRSVAVHELTSLNQLQDSSRFRVVLSIQELPSGDMIITGVPGSFPSAL